METLISILDRILPRMVQDAVQAASGALVAHGVITQDQEQGLYGSLFFIAMLVINHFISKYRRKQAAIKGGEAVATAATDDFTRADVRKIVKENVK